MDDSDEVISVWKNVSIEINENYLAPGTLKMIRSGLSIIFYWIPQNSTNTDTFDIDPGHISFAIELRQVDSISFYTSYIEYGIIELLFKDFSVFPRIFFNDHGSLAVSHLIQYLLNQKIATMSLHSESMVSISLKVSSITHLSENITNSIRFKTLVDHWRALDLLGVHKPIEINKPVCEKEKKNKKYNFNNICFERGISHKDRCNIWPLFLDTNKKYHMEDPKNLTKRQQEEISTKISSIHTDTEDLSKSIPQSKVFMQFLRDILCSIAIFYPNSTFQSGLCKILSAFIQVFVKSFQEKSDKSNTINITVIMNDGRILDYNEARYYIFRLFISFLVKSGNHYVMTQTDKFYQSFTDRINAIIESVDLPVSSRLAVHQMKNLKFLLKSIYLLYSSDFDQEKLLRLWDSIVSYSDKHKTIFILFFHAAITILFFNPMFMMNKNSSSEEILQFAEEEKKKVNLELVIRMAEKLIKIVKNKKNLEWIFQPFDEENDYIDYHPIYLTISNE